MAVPAKYARGCTEYITVNYPMEIGFPVDMVVCDLCPFCHTENSGTRFRCLETGEILPYHNKDFGLRCPLGLYEAINAYRNSKNKNNEEDN